MEFNHSLQFARKLDRNDSLKSFRNQFHIPKVKGKTAIYFTGNSLGLQPKATKKYIDEELQDWANLGVEGHVHSRRPWVSYQKFSKTILANIVGARPAEVVAMNQLTVNLHLLLVSFYRPTKERYKIITEHGAFSSDQYAFESQIRFHNLNPDDTLIELKPREGEFTLRTEDILQAIRDHRDEIALVIFGGVQYYTGQLFDIKKITAAGHEAGAIVGFDLAHAVGNVPLNLHRDDVDFAVWCSYKYLNSGPGAIAGCYVHERFSQADLPRFAGWWGHNEKERFLMRKGFKPMKGVDGWQLSNHPILLSAAHLASLEIFKQAGMKNLVEKSVQLTGYLEFILNQIDPSHKYFNILTPSNPKERGCQLSIFMKKNGKKVFSDLTRAGVIADWREPNVIRVAPVPLYNTFEEVYLFGEIFRKALGVKL
ncbi:kynureninase [Chryseosolibacter indicus]|uniref:Kynureninase n=1 Tax=Chryseosolibacter indicus TaxID=2782351 RepID=A0ABS5VNR0_9BACT|nr:kynureninase [Chryseosolibacter indicus]MBT1702996.1 kynureninase [Chryseosolibacter indicus]